MTGTNYGIFNRTLETCGFELLTRWVMFNTRLFDAHSSPSSTYDVLISSQRGRLPRSALAKTLLHPNQIGRHDSY